MTTVIANMGSPKAAVAKMSEIAVDGGIVIGDTNLMEHVEGRESFRADRHFATITVTSGYWSDEAELAKIAKISDYVEEA